MVILHVLNLRQVRTGVYWFGGRIKSSDKFLILRLEVGSEFGQFWQRWPRGHIRSSDKSTASAKVGYHSDINLWDTDEFPYTLRSDPCFVLYNGVQLDHSCQM